MARPGHACQPVSPGTSQLSVLVPLASAVLKELEQLLSVAAVACTASPEQAFPQILPREGELPSLRPGLPSRARAALPSG